MGTKKDNLRATREISLRVALSLLVSGVLCQFPLYEFESKLYDLRFRVHGKRAPLPNITIIGYDDTTIKALGQGFPPAPEQLAEVLNKVTAAQPRAVGVLYNLSQTYPDTNAQKQLASRLHTKAVPLYMIEGAEGYEPKILPETLSAVFTSTITGQTRDRGSYAKDSVSRRLITHYNDTSTSELQLAQLLNPNLEVRHSWLNSSFKGLTLREVLINFDGPPQTYPLIPFSDVLNGHAKLDNLLNHVVLISRADYVDPEESRMNPFDTTRPTLLKPEAVANSIATLVRENTLARAPNWVNIVVTFATAFVASYITMGSTPALGVVLVLLFVGGIGLVSQILFSSFGLVLSTLHPILGVFVAYYVFIPYRLIVEYRKRFYYQRKHALLKQVEELKTNFISMMSHDIKTPIAKIQGIAEGGLMRSKDLEQSKAFQSIISSSTDLTQFVNRILNLSKIESGALKLEFTSKDINALVHECISDVEFLAQKRSIKIRTDLEPMFSVPMDPSLIKQVIQNLLDNALKYSPEGSTVTVRTRETPTAVEFTIVDEGEGIEEADLQHVFEKFYRPQTSLAKTTMGTGLGLYLVKYFVELHKGNVTASSAPGRGSTFSFSLPVVTTEGSEIGRSQHV